MSNPRDLDSNEHVILKAAETGKAVAVIRMIFKCLMSMWAFLSGIALFWLWVNTPRWELLVFTLVWLVISAMIFQNPTGTRNKSDG